MSRIHIPTVEYRRGIYYLVLEGKTSYERSYQHGVALEFPIKKALRQFRAWIRDVAGLQEPEAMILDFAESTPYLAWCKPDPGEGMEASSGISWIA